MEGIDDYYVWECRIHHGVRYQKVPLPFPESVKIGMEFNIALDRKQKLDQSLLTNAVMLEICEFAKAVTKSEKYFLFEMLEFNFDLGVDVDNELECYEYASRVQTKIKQLKEQVKLKPRKLAEAFPLPHLNLIKKFTASEVPARYYPRRNRIADISFLTDGSKDRNCPENQRSESNRVLSSTFVIKRKGRVGLKVTGDIYPFCRKLGLTLTVRPDETPKLKLDPNLITVGVMIELLDFSKALCGSYTQIIHDLVQHNFCLELDRLQFRIQLNKLLERKCSCLTTEDRETFRRQTFAVQNKKQEQKYKKRKKPDTDFQELEKVAVVNKRRETLRHRDSDAQEMFQDSGLSYMCPVDFETETHSDTELGAEKNKFKHLSTATVETELAASLHMKQEEEDVFVSAVQPQVESVHPNDQTVKTDTDLFSGDKYNHVNFKTPKQKVWARRAPRSKQILKSSRVNDLFARSREIGLDFNVGSGSKQNLDLQLLTNWVLWEILKFANAMTKSLRSFLLDILGNNFRLFIQDDLHLRNIIFYVITKVRLLQSHPARQKMEFLSSPFKFPEVYTMHDVKSNIQVETEQQTDCDLSGSDETLYPFCKKLGLNLWSTQERTSSQKLHLNILTTGAVLEIFSLIKELCGSVREMVRDVLEHNFDLDLQNGATEAAQVIQKWFMSQKSIKKNQNMSPKISRWLNTVVPLSGHSQSNPQPASNGPKRLDTDGFHLQGHTQVGSFQNCQEIGLDLDVSSRSDVKKKLHLQMLTRGVLLEVHQYVEQNCACYVPALYDILDYNFDLSSQSHRQAEFAWSIASQVIAMVGKNGRKGQYLNTVFELPMDTCESSQFTCKDEAEDGHMASALNNDDDILFIRKLKPIDIEVEIE